MHSLDIIDSHTGGEPTRVVVAGFPDLGGGSLAEQRQRFGQQFDRWRSAVACEPRGSDPVVGALLLPAQTPGACAGTIFFNNVGYLGMCGHGTIGLVRTLQFLGRIGPGEHRIDTPVGTVGARLHEDGRVSVDNVESWRHAAQVKLDVPGYGAVSGDVVWGGNWFFIAKVARVIALTHVRELSEFSEAIRAALVAARITGADGAEIDHIELETASSTPGIDGRNFVLCPGLAYDRSPCGTGTSAKLACLAADGKLAPGQVWRQESVLGSVFEGQYRVGERGVHPTITGSAHITARTQLLIDDADPFAWGIGAR